MAKAPRHSEKDRDVHQPPEQGRDLKTQETLTDAPPSQIRASSSPADQPPRPRLASFCALCPGSCATPAAIDTLTVKPLHVCFQEPQRERLSAKERQELPANCSTALLALVKIPYLSGEFQFAATGSCCACASQMTELSNSIISPAPKFTPQW